MEPLHIHLQAGRRYTLQRKPLLLAGVNVFLHGHGATIDALSSSRHFDVAGQATLQLSHVRLINGRAEVGGAIQVRGGSSLTMESVHIDSSTAERGGGVAGWDPPPKELRTDTLSIRNSRRCGWEKDCLGRVLAVSISPDGSKIASGSDDGMLRISDTGVHTARLCTQGTVCLGCLCVVALVFLTTFPCLAQAHCKSLPRYTPTRAPSIPWTFPSTANGSYQDRLTGASRCGQPPPPILHSPTGSRW